MIEFLSWTGLISISIVIIMLLYKLGKLKNLLVAASKLLFSLFIPWFGFLIFVLFFDGYEPSILVVLAISIALFMALLWYAIHSKQLKSYFKSIAWIIGTPILLIVTYVIVAIVTHDPIVPRPLTVHQLLTGYNVVYTHDGKLYQNEEYVMDLEEIFWSWYKDNLECYFCFWWTINWYGDIYIHARLLNIDGYIVNIETKKIESLTREPDHRWRMGPLPILHMPQSFYNGANLYVNNKKLENQNLVRSNKSWFLSEWIETVWKGWSQTLSTKSYYRYSYDDTWFVEISYTGLLNPMSEIAIDSINSISFIWIIDSEPVFTAHSPSEKYILQWNQQIFSWWYDTAMISDNLLYIYSGWNIYQNNVLVTSWIANYYWEESFNINLCDYRSLCHIGESFYNFWQIPHIYVTTPESSFNFIIRNNLPWFRLTDRWFVSTFGYTGDYKQKQWLGLVSSFNKYIQTLLWYWYTHIREGDRYSRHSLFKAVSDHHLNTDTIFLRPFHDSGREYSQAIPLISGIDNFLGIYPTTPPENNDPNADINVGQLIMDTYFPKEIQEVEAVDEKTLLLDLLQQRELRLQESNTDQIVDFSSDQ